MQQQRERFVGVIEGDNIMKKFFKTLVPTLIFLAVSIIVPAIISTVKVTQFTMAHPGDVDALMNYSMNMASDTGYIQSALIATQIVSLIIFLLIYFVGMKKKINTFSGRFTAVSFPVLIVGFAALELIISCILFLIQFTAPGALENYSNMIQMAGLADMSVMSTILTLVGAPIVEEICFRGITMKWAKEFSSKFWAVNLFQALLFGIAHLNIVQGIYAFVLGLILGYVANKYKSLWASIAGHLAFNFAGTYLVSWLLGDIETINAKYIIAFVLSIAIFAAAAFFVTKKEKDYVEAVVEAKAEENADTLEAEE